MEIFKDIEGYFGLYQVSNMGNVKSFHTGKEKILKPKNDKDGYLFVVLSKQGKVKTCKIHRLVAQSFIENPQNLPQVNHKNEIKTDNRASNLEWCDCQYNIDYSQSKRVLCVETNKIYSSTMEVHKQLGFSQGNISQCCNCKRKTCGGYTWRYV
jgi:hypothetical protein